jgi:pilus assembly protein Flp/PilA
MPAKESSNMLQHVLALIDQLRGRDERGQTLVEYGLLLALIAIVVIAVLLILGPTVSGIFQSVNDQL